MLPSFLLALREGLEAALVIGVTFGILAKTGRNTLRPAVWRGVAAAILLSLLVALSLQVIGAEFEGRAEEIFEGVTMLAAAALLTWMILWMQRQGASLQRRLEQDVASAARRGAAALFAVAFLAVAREGLELSLFLTASTLSSGGLSTLLGALLGLGAAAMLGYTLFATTRRLSLKRFFLLTNILLVLFAAGLVAHSVHEFNEAGLVPPLVAPFWDANALLPEASPLGQILTALFGYNANPSLAEVVAYFAYFALLWLALNRLRLANRSLISKPAP
jgi:high-affinity iron transporter